jgi:NTP pyrophosphatase (non-canonical NTP hydrolase)
MDKVKTDYLCRGELNALADRIAVWRERQGFSTTWLEVPAKLMLTVTELSEAMEAIRHVPLEVLEALEGGRAGPIDIKVGPVVQGWLANFREELADTVIRILDMTEAYGIDIEAEIARKMDINEGREYKHGKEL